MKASFYNAVHLAGWYPVTFIIAVKDFVFRSNRKTIGIAQSRGDDIQAAAIWGMRNKTPWWGVISALTPPCQDTGGQGVALAK